MTKSLILILLAVGLLFTACSKTSEPPAEAPAADNPFFAEYDTPFQVPPFDIIKPEDFIPAYEKGMEQQKAEIENSKEMLSSLLGKTIRYFSYPYGRLSQVTVDHVIEAGFEAALGTQLGFVRSGDDLFQLRRCTVHNWDHEIFKFELERFLLHREN